MRIICKTHAMLFTTKSKYFAWVYLCEFTELGWILCMHRPRHDNDNKNKMYERHKNCILKSVLYDKVGPGQLKVSFDNAMAKTIGKNK